jgi:cytochrome c biogenesis protein CcmG/thiol:disulfide interchange protein DsbE
MRYLWGLPIVAVLAMIWVLAQGLKLDPSEIESPLVNQAAPPFQSTRLGSGDKAALEDLQGEVTLFNVWASWCVACRQEHPLLNELARTGTVRIVGLNYKDEPAAAQDWLARLGNPYAWSVVDPKGRIGIDYGVYGVPETFVLDRAGTIRAKRIGPITPDYLQQELLPLVRELQAERG